MWRTALCLVVLLPVTLWAGQTEGPAGGTKLDGTDPFHQNRDDAATLLQRIMEARPKYQDLEREFIYLERVETRDLDEAGAVEKQKIEAFEVTPSSNGEYRRLVEKDGLPLSDKERSDQEEDFQKHIRKEMSLSEKQRKKNAERLQRRIEKFRTRLKEAIEVFDFTPLPDDVVEGQSVRRFRFQPKRDYEPTSRATGFLSKLGGQIWIDASRDQFVRIELEAREDVTFLKGIFGRISKGSRAEIRGQLLQDLWLVEHADVRIDARLYFLKKYRQHVTVDFEEYQRFSVATEETIDIDDVKKRPPS